MRRTRTLISASILKLWVRTDDEDDQDYIYRGIEEPGSPLKCYDPQARNEPKALWTVRETQKLALSPCKDDEGAAEDGTLYTLERAP